jgi:hypothetical protein
MQWLVETGWLHNSSTSSSQVATGMNVASGFRQSSALSKPASPLGSLLTNLVHGVSIPQSRPCWEDGEGSLLGSMQEPLVNFDVQKLDMAVDANCQASGFEVLCVTQRASLLREA